MWEEWHDPDSEKPVRSFPIITIPANKQMFELHHRMPVILEPEKESMWLAASTPLPDALDILKPYSGELKIYPVSTALNTARSQGKELIVETQPLNPDETETQVTGSLF